MDLNNCESEHERLNQIRENLEAIRDELIKINEANGTLARFHAMKKEIEREGWDKICAKYHPDINTGDPAAFELFAMYRYIYYAIHQ